MVRELKEGQDMSVEVEEISQPTLTAKREWEKAVDAVEGGAIKGINLPADGIVLRLRF
jgi:hypothetical protein